MGINKRLSHDLRNQEPKIDMTKGKETSPLSGRVMTEGDELFYEVRGQGTPLLMIPGAFGDGWWYSLFRFALGTGLFTTGFINSKMLAASKLAKIHRETITETRLKSGDVFRFFLNRSYCL